MSTSQNGWPANDSSRTQSYKIPGSSRAVRLVKGDAGYLLVHFAAWFHVNIEKVDVGVLDDWGYAERNIRGSSTTLSNHASGTALDLNATLHPLAKVLTFPGTKMSKIRAQLKVYEGVIRWGGDYHGRKDEMHFEINVSPSSSAVARVAAKLRGAPTGSKPDAPAAPSLPLEYPAAAGADTIAVSSINYAAQGGYFNSGQAEAQKDVDVFLGLWRRHVPASMADKADRDLRVYRDFVKATNWKSAGEQFTGILKSFQAIHGLTVDGVFGPQCSAAVHHYGYGVTAKYVATAPVKPVTPVAPAKPAAPLGDLISLSAIAYAATGGFFNTGQAPALEDAQIVGAWMRRLGVINDRDYRVWDQFRRASNWASAGVQYKGIVRKFQARYSLAADGIVGPATKAKLQSLLVHDGYRVVA